MGVWDKTTPLGTDSKSQGDDKIRELKDALEEALSHEDSTFPGATPSSTPIFIPGFLRGATGSRPTGDSLVSGRFYCNTTLNVIERYNGASWDAVATLIPSGTKMVFYQASVPTGWTAVAVNDKFLRVVTGGGTGGTTGGTHAASTSLAHDHTITSADIQHKHATWAVQDTTTGNIYGVGEGTNGTLAGYGGDIGTFSASVGPQANKALYYSGDMNTNETHAHGGETTGDGGFTGSFAYADVCIGTKD